MPVFNQGNMSSTTNVVNGTVYTQNVINLGGGGSCSAGTEFCQEGYSIYVPCLKNITRGQKVCFQMYLADKGNQDVTDTDDICGMTLNLSGPFGCPYGDYTWPDDIIPVQRNVQKPIAGGDGFGRDTYNVDLGYIEIDGDKIREVDSWDVNVSGDGYNVNIEGTYGKFYKGEVPYLNAQDSTTHVFVGWTTADMMEGICGDYRIDDIVISTDNVFNPGDETDGDIVVYAVYRKRRTYRVMIDFENRHSYFMVTYAGRTVMLSDKKRDYVEVKEGYHFVVKCCPLTSKNKDGEIVHVYNFYGWADGEQNQVREYLAEDRLFKNGELRLLSICREDKNKFDVFNGITPTEDIFGVNLPELNVESEYESVVSDRNIIESEGVTQVSGPDGSYLKVEKDGHLAYDCGCESGKDLRIVLDIDTSHYDFNEPDVDGITEPVGEIVVRNGSNETRVGLTSAGDNEIICDFKMSEDSVFDIISGLDILYINNIVIYEIVTVDKGKVELCIPPEETVKFYTGELNVSGAVCVNDSWYGLDKVQVGVVNRNAKIQISDNG